MKRDCDNRTCGKCARCGDAARVFRIIADKRAGKPAPHVEAIDYDTPFFRLLKRDTDFGAKR